MMQRYFYTLLLLIGTVFIVIALFNRIMNPFAIFAGPQWDFNRVKIDTTNYMRMVKAYQVRNLRPDAIILGTSRALLLDANHTLFQDTTAYNLAITSGSLYESWRYLQHAHAIRPLRKIVIGLDHFAFHYRTKENFREQRLVVDAQWKKYFRLTDLDYADLTAILFSNDALKASIRSLRSSLQHQPSVTTTVAVNSAPAAGLPHTEKVVRAGGHRKMFTEMESENFINYREMETTLRGDVIGSSSDPKLFRQMLRFCYQNGIELMLFISPSHARFWEIWHLTGLEPLIEQWKRNLVEAIEQEAQLAGKPAYVLRDFSGYNAVTTEPVPIDNDVATIMRGYTEGGHYTAEVGSLILTTFAEDRLLHPGFGVRIDGENIDSHLQYIRQQGELFRNENRDELVDLVEIYNNYFR